MKYTAAHTRVREPRFRGLGRHLGWVAMGIGVLLIAGFAWLYFAPCGLGGCAPVSELESFQAEGSELLDRNGKPFARLATVDRRVVPLDSLPEHLPQAFIAIEDQRFFDHSGVDWRRVGGALVSNVRERGVAEGGSTITMQLARNLFPDRLPYQERSFRRKLMEVRIARQIERAFSKEKILELYLNHIYLGEGAYGVEAAAQEYFGKPAAELDVTEAAVLAALPQAPSRVNPRENREASLERRNVVLRRMAGLGFISKEELEQARESELDVARSTRGSGNEPGPYFRSEVRRQLEQIVGDRFYTAGFRVHTTFDPAAQQAAERELFRQLDAIEAGEYGSYRHPTYPEAKGEGEGGTTEYLQGVVVMMDAETGAVRALIGGRDFEDSKFNRATQALRQPGSAFKPFVYLTALERGLSPVHRIEDSPIRLTVGGRTWEPRNYTGTYDGPMTIREGLTRSKNTVTVRLAQEVGMGSVIENAREMGIENDLSALPSTALGAAEVRPINLTQAYAALANGGHRVPVTYITRVETRSGEVIWEAPESRARVLDPAVAFVTTTMLQDVVNRGTGTMVRSAGYRGPAAGKTGTTNSATDVWFVGYTPELVTAVWIGMDRPQTVVRGASGGTLAAPVWGRFMSRVHQGRPQPSGWSPPPGVVSTEVDRATGLAVESGCPSSGDTYTEYFVRSLPPRQPCYTDTAWLASSDTSWRDEEWSTGDLDDGAGEVAPGVFWPELQDRRDRGDSLPRRAEQITRPRDSIGVPAPRPRAGDRTREPVRNAPPAPPRDTAPPRPPEPRQPENRDPPELLGERARDRRLPPPTPPESPRTSGIAPAPTTTRGGNSSSGPGLQ